MITKKQQVKRILEFLKVKMLRDDFVFSAALDWNPIDKKGKDSDVVTITFTSGGKKLLDEWNAKYPEYSR